MFLFFNFTTFWNISLHPSQVPYDLPLCRLDCPGLNLVAPLGYGMYLFNTVIWYCVDQHVVGLCMWPSWRSFDPTVGSLFLRFFSCACRWFAQCDINSHVLELYIMVCGVLSPINKLGECGFNVQCIDILIYILVCSVLSPN